MHQAGHPVEEPVRVVGPYFTGSQTSLQFAVGDWWEQAHGWFGSNPLYRFDAISGNASAVRASDFFGYEANKSDFPHWQADKFVISGTVVPTRVLLKAALHYLTLRDGATSAADIGKVGETPVPGKVAMLTEANTGFGNAFASWGRTDEILVLRFPLHISQVKTEADRAFQKRDEKIGLGHDDPLVGSLRPDDAKLSPGEGVPPQGGSTTTAGNAQVLARILATVSKERCRYVGVVASDARDKLFLVRLIREYCPDVQVFVTDSDLLLTHPDYRYAMRGVLVASTYPLVAKNQRWVDPDAAERVLFPSGAAQGYYNATLLHVGLKEKLVEYRAPAFALGNPDLSNRATMRPPAWVSVVAPDGSFVPLHVYANYDDPTDFVATDPIDDPEYLSSPAAGLDYPGAVLPVGLGLAVFWTLLLGRGWISRASRLHYAAAGPGSPALFSRNLMFGSQALVAAPVVVATWTRARLGHWAEFWPVLYAVASALLLAGLLAALAAPFVRSISRTRDDRTPFRDREKIAWSAVNGLSVAAVSAFAGLAVGRFFATGDDARRALFFVRATDLGTGLSPLVPLFVMALGFFAWGGFQLRRRQLADRPAGTCPFPDDSTFAAARAADAALRTEAGHEAIARRHPRRRRRGPRRRRIRVGRVAPGVADARRLGVGRGLLRRLRRPVRPGGGDHDPTLLPLAVRRGVARRPGPDAADPGGRPAAGRGRGDVRPLPVLVPVQAGRPARVYPPVAAAGRGGGRRDGPGRVADAAGHGRRGRGVDPRRRRIGARAKLAAAAATCLRVLGPRWKTLPVDDAFGAAETPAADDPAWVGHAEGLAAAQALAYLGPTFAQVRNLVWAALVVPSLLLVAATSYPFHPEKLLLLGLVALCAAGVGAVVVVMVKMNRDEFVSRVARTTPGRLAFDAGFVGSMMTYVVPVLGVVAAQLSGSFRWALEPLLRVLK